MYRKLAVSIVVALLSRLDTPPATYQPPLDRPVESGFDVRHGPYGAGNRGLDYAVRPGDVVGSIGSGTVVFAGPVAGATWVTVLHPDGLRSSYGPMATLDVTAGQEVGAGDRLGTTGSTFHLGVRRGETYIDPATLFEVRDRFAHLIPVGSISNINPTRAHTPGGG